MANTYTPPGVTVEQVFSTNTSYSGQSLPALVIGPNYGLHRYAVTAEKAGIALAGGYVPTADTDYSWPSKDAGSVVDQAYAKVYFEAVRAQVFPNTALGTTSAVVTKVAIPGTDPVVYYPNRIASSALVFATANGTARSVDFSNRDVQVGDVVAITDGTHTLTSKVHALVASTVAASVGAATNETGNEASQTEVLNGAVTFTGSGSAPAGITVTNTTSAYKGYNSLGIVSDTYTVEVTKADSNLADVEFTVASANGAFAPVTGAVISSASSSSSGGGIIEGALVLDVNNGNHVSLLIVCATNAATILVGNKWSVNMKATVAQVTPTVAGTYTGSDNITYIATVVRGGPLYTGTNADVCARVQVTSNNVDASSAVNVGATTAFALGTKGLSITFATGSNNTGLVLGDRYDVAVTGPTSGAIRTLVLQDNLTSALVAASSLTVKLFLVRASVEIPQVANVAEDTLNWVPAAEKITINQSITITDASVVAGEVPVALPVAQAAVYVEHRDLLQASSNSITSLTDPTAVEGVFGRIDAANPLAQGVYNALLNSNGAPVYSVGVTTDDLDGYNYALALAAKTNTYYSIVPLSFGTDIQTAVVAHVNAMSTSAALKWRLAWLGAKFESNKLLFDTHNGANYTATVSADPMAAGTQYTLVTVANATFITSGVRAGDAVYINFRMNTSGVVEFDTYLVDEIRSETTLTVTSAFPDAITTPIKVQVARVYTLDEKVDDLVARASGFANRRVLYVFPGQYGQSGSTLPGYFLGASLGGQRSGVAPHQPLTNMPLLGPTDLSEVLALNETQLNKLAAAGIWIITQAAVNAEAYTRHQLSTDTTSLNTKENSKTTNVDSMAYGFSATVRPFIGKYNITDTMLLLVRSRIADMIAYYQTGTYTETAGNQLNDATIVLLRKNPNLQDHVQIKLALNTPDPDNYTDIELDI